MNAAGIRLTAKQREVVLLLAKGKTCKEIGASLGFGVDYKSGCQIVDSRLKAARRNTGATTNEQMIFRLCQFGYFD